MAKILMIVYNELINDARVQRAALALSIKNQVSLVGLNSSDFVLSGVKVISIETKSSNKYKYLDFVRQVKKIIKQVEHDILYVHDYYCSIFLGISQGKKVYDAHELILPDKRFHMSGRDYFFYLVEKKTISKSDLVICASEERSRIMQEYYQLNELPITIRNISKLPCISDDFSINLENRYENFFSNDSIKLVYAGVLSYERNIEKLIDLINKSKFNIELMFIGSGPAKEYLEKKAELQIPNKYVFTGSIPYRYLSTLLLRCDIGFLNYPATNLNNLYCAPNKIYEYASVELPMLAGENPVIKNIFSEYGIGISSDDSKLLDSLQFIIENLQTMKFNCTEFILRNSWKNEQQKLITAVSKLSC